MGIFGKKPVGTDMINSVLGSGLGMGAAQGMANAIGPGPSQAALTAQQMAQHTYPSMWPPEPMSRYLSYNINVRETSNGYVITLGEIVRVCTTEEGKLLHEIGAAIGEYMLSLKEGGER